MPRIRRPDLQNVSDDCRFTLSFDELLQASTSVGRQRSAAKAVHLQDMEVPSTVCLIAPFYPSGCLEVLGA